MTINSFYHSFITKCYIWRETLYDAGNRGLWWTPGQAGQCPPQKDESNVSPIFSSFLLIAPPPHLWYSFKSPQHFLLLVLDLNPMRKYDKLNFHENKQDNGICSGKLISRTVWWLSKIYCLSCLSRENAIYCHFSNNQSLIIWKGTPFYKRWRQTSSWIAEDSWSDESSCDTYWHTLSSVLLGEITKPSLAAS